MTELQRRVLVEAEFLFYLATSPGLFVTPKGDSHNWISGVPTSELVRVNELVRPLLRGGSLAIRPPLPIKVEATTTAIKP